VTVIDTASPRSRTFALWALWAAVVTVVVAFATWALHVLVDAPHALDGWWAVGGATVLVPVLALWVRPLGRFAAPVLRFTVTAAGLAAMVLAIYIVVVVGLGEDVNGTEHRVLGLSMVAGAVSVALAGPVRARLRDATRRTDRSTHRTAESALANFGARMTRSVPMDELLLQLAESLRETMAPLGAEVWTGEDGVLDRTTSVPDRGPARIRLRGPELAAAVGARVSGSSWAAMWLPDVLAPFGSPDEVHVRVAPVTHLGGLLGLIVVARPQAAGGFSTEEDSLLADIARQVGLALHNVHLDSALQESLDELRAKNRMLQESQARIVTAADESRRRIERDLHDGAQQRLVALAVRLQLTKMKADDPQVLGEMLDDLGVQITETIEEVRELAHGIYPPLLRDSGLGEALKAAAARSPVPVTTDVRTTRRFDPSIEAAVYFCCLEAMQNASKYAGPEATVTVRLTESPEALVFEVVDDGAGFDPATVSENHGFLNMRDRLGAHDGELTVESAPGAGTTVRGVLPVGEGGLEPPQV
jgi:signal transduction histidine kinase